VQRAGAKQGEALHEIRLERYVGDQQKLKTWVPDLRHVVVERYWQMPRGFMSRHVFHAFSSLPVLRRITPCVVRIRFGERESNTERETIS